MINNRYQILKKIGEGRSCVYHCLDTRTNNSFAMKVILPGVSMEEKKKFIEEYRIIRRLNHPGIIKVFGYGDVLETGYDEIPKDSSFILLELFNGCELSELKNVSENELKEILIQILSVLQYLHMSNIIYYDLKAENILVKTEGNSLLIKLIDFGFAGVLNQEEKNTRGTAEYIAPELLKNEPYDHRVDYYSLGILLYKIIYGKFPFNNSSEIKIFRAQVEDEFEYASNSFSHGINTVLKKLLSKDPQLRYINAPEIFNEFNYVPAAEIISTWIPAETFSGRKDMLNILNNYLVNYSGGDVFVLHGAEGSGKTALLKAFSESRTSVIFIDNIKASSGIPFIISFIEKFLYNSEIYKYIDDELINRFRNFISNTPHHFAEEIKGILSQVLNKCRFILVIDDFNYLDEVSLQLFREIIPLLQVYNIKIVLTETAEKPPLADFIHNLHQLELSPFTDTQVQEMLDKSFYPYYPKEELKKLILQHADLLPGSIEVFIKDLIFFGIIKFTPGTIKIISDESTIEILKHSHEYFYKLRIHGLSKKELSTAQYLSAFENIPGREIYTKVMNTDSKELGGILSSLKTKNVLQIMDGGKPGFTSAGMKDYIYSGIKDRKKIHLQIAKSFEKNKVTDYKELAYQYESAGEYDKSIKYYLELYNEAKSIDAYTYQKKLLEHIISFPMEDEKKYPLKFELCKVFLNSADIASALEQCDELLLYITDPEILNELLILKGTALIASGRPEEGIRQIEDLVDILEDEVRKTKLLTEIASAYLDINNYTRCEELCKEIITNNSTPEESRGKCYNFLGLISIHRDNDFDRAFELFKSAEEIYSSAGLKFRTAQMLTNLGNISNIKGDYDSAENLWNSSLELNLSMGNLQHEATVLLNFGVLNFMKLDFEKSVEYYKKALSIFSTTGDQRGEGLVNHNLGEIYYLSCEYDNSLKYFTEARLIFENLQDINEELETIFMLGLLYTALGSRENLKIIVQDFNNLLLRESGEKHDYNFRYLNLLLKEESLNFYHEIKSIIRYYKKESVKNNFFRTSLTAVEFLFKKGLYKEALEELTSKDFSDASEDNLFYKAWREYYLGMVKENLAESEAFASEHFLNAHGILEKLSISELTWRVMTILADFYYRRGNLLRAEEYAYYSYALIEHISDGITNEELKNSYLAKENIKSALEIYKKILPGNG